MTAFIRTVLGYDTALSTAHPDGGVLGHVKGYFGCVEAQGRGSLHCHMVVWVEGGLNPDDIQKRLMNHDTEFGQRLLAFLDDTISSEIPPPPIEENKTLPSTNPCRHPVARAWDLHQLATACQQHRHAKTCFKYCKPGEPQVCRFDLDPENVRLCSSFDESTGEICLRCLDGMVNNFNRTILEAMCCNMDIQFIGSGEGAKAITYYITNYITKSQLKTHVAYAALELAVRRLGEYDQDGVARNLTGKPGEDSYTVYAKYMLRRCAYAILTHQELSGQQVASYLMDYEDCFTNQQFANLYWTSMERYIGKLLHSPECDTSYKNVDLDTPSSAMDEVDPDTEDITINVDDRGQLIQNSTQLSDYIYRGHKFDCINVWDFVAQMQK
ncbi:hypothetical protein BC629DRAFT_1297549, partial [Irpex lacteus]